MTANVVDFASVAREAPRRRPKRLLATSHETANPIGVGHDLGVQVEDAVGEGQKDIFFGPAPAGWGFLFRVGAIILWIGV
jgi:hypothetical protein